MGGTKALPRLQLEMDVYGLLNISIVVGCRPLIASSEFDPGPLSGSQHLSSLVRSCVDDRGPSTKKSVASAMSPTLMATHAEIRELLDVQEAKLKYASSAAKEVESLFRWSHLRWMAARTRLFEHWRDLVDATIDGSTNNHLDLALCQATMLFERCIFEDMHSLEMRFQLTRLTYAMVVASLQGIKPEFDITQAATDTRKYDLLWIYSVGAWVEDSFSAALSPSDTMQYAFFANQFTKLAAQLSFVSIGTMAPPLCENYLYIPKHQDKPLQRLLGINRQKPLSFRVQPLERKVS
ncbi:hypothetical protein EDD36DRAFT_460352 [Exophiala viscosa]|uniref:Uncharacterized protein n=1 Tax=Exophiala viscosa TaxID=2486360 RepID=A0AAN6IIH8_9EURO|nr:hypothetical protein EDD36DRAFT_460352 [Exophiala viscosa]